MDDGLSETGAVTIAFGKRINALVDNGVQKTHFHGAIDRFRFVVSAQSSQFGGETKEAADRHVRVSRGVLRQVADEALSRNGILDHVKATYENGAGSWRDEPGNHSHGGRFA